MQRRDLRRSRTTVGKARSGTKRDSGYRVSAFPDRKTRPLGKGHIRTKRIKEDNPESIPTCFRDTISPRANCELSPANCGGLRNPWIDCNKSDHGRNERRLAKKIKIYSLGRDEQQFYARRNPEDIPKHILRLGFACCICVHKHRPSTQRSAGAVELPVSSSAPYHVCTLVS